jgi:hypothetical protein
MLSSSSNESPSAFALVILLLVLHQVSQFQSLGTYFFSIVAPSATATFAVVSTASTDPLKLSQRFAVVALPLQQQLPLHLQLERFLTLLVVLP